jgi:hypothetical protein
VQMSLPTMSTTEKPTGTARARPLRARGAAVQGTKGASEMQTRPTAPTQTQMPNDRGGQLVLLPTGRGRTVEAMGRVGHPQAPVSGHVTQRKAKMTTATTANLTEREAGETESLAIVVAAVAGVAGAVVVAAVEMEGAKAGAEAEAAADGVPVGGATKRVFSLARLRLKDAREASPSTACWQHSRWWVRILANASMDCSCQPSQAPLQLLLPLPLSVPMRIEDEFDGGCCQRRTVRYPHHTMRCNAMRYTRHGSTARHPLTPAG